MRKLVVFVMLMMCVISAQAQWKVTPEAGMNVTKYTPGMAAWWGCGGWTETSGTPSGRNSRTKRAAPSPARTRR